MRAVAKLLLALVLLVSILALGIKWWSQEATQPRPIETLPISAESFVGSPALANPIEFSVPSHPYMADQGRNAMHADGYSSDVHPGPGPLGIEPQLQTRIGTKMPGGQCATVTFSRDGNLLALCAAISGFRIQLLTPRTLKLLAEVRLPTRPSTWRALLARDRRHIMEDSSGAYFYLDQADRVVMADSAQQIRRLGHRQSASGEWEFYDDGRWDLSDEVPHDCLTPFNPFPAGECDPITAVMPDHHGLLWWVTRFGRVGTLNLDNGHVSLIQLANEEIQNGFSVAADGVYVVSDHALYRFQAGPEGTPQVGWRELYDRGSQRRVGSINQGSGTTPTLLGTEFVTITDNADRRINLLVYKRQQAAQGQRLVCSVPVFRVGHSATDNSMIAFNRTILLENNAGYTRARAQSRWDNAGGGIVRVDIREDHNGCDLIWESPLASPSTVPKIAAATGLAYFYTYHRLPDAENAWYLAALDVGTGETRFQIHTGVGVQFDNNWAPITLAPDGTAYVGTSRGLVAIWDNPHSTP